MSDKERIGFISDFVLAILFGVIPMPAVIRWLGWFVCWVGLLLILQKVIDPINRLPQETRSVGLFVLAIAFILVFRTTVISMWHEEKAAELEGDLIGAGPAINDGKQHGFPMLEIGETTLIMAPDGVADIFPFFKDSGVRIEWGYKGPLLTTPVRDRNGNLVAEIIRNHWRVYPLYCADKNYTKSALEVQDSAGHIVLQARILPNRIQLQGEWWNTEGHGIRLVKPVHPSPATGSKAVFLTRQDQKTEWLIPPLFQYPSKDHWGELNN